MPGIGLARELLIGDLDLGEIDDAIDLWNEIGLIGADSSEAEADIRLALDSPGSTVLVGRVNRRLTATAMVGFDGHRGSVYYLAVAPEYQGRGYREAMMRACERWVAERGGRRMHLMVHPDNIELTRFYRDVGYSRSNLQVLRRRLGGGED
jgi:ribosomal protein S18 acetylase RimI-like enzyme